MCQCWCGASGCSKPVPLRDGFAFQRDNNPACFRTRHTLAGLTATTFASSIMNVSRRYPSNGFFRWKFTIASFSHGSSQKSRGTQLLCSFTRP